MKIINLSIIAFLMSSVACAQDGISIQFEGTGADISGGIHYVDICPSSPE